MDGAGDTRRRREHDHVRPVVLLWEIYSLGLRPYAEVASSVHQGHRLEQPKLCPNNIYALMLECWSFQPEARPPFAQLAGRLYGSLEQLQREHCSQFSSWPFQKRIVPWHREAAMHRFKIADSMANLVCSKPTFQLVCIKSYRETTNSIFCSAVLKF